MRKIFVLWLLLLPVVSLAQPYTVKQLGIEKGLSNNYVVSIAQDKQGFLWFATEEGLNKFDGTRFITYLKNEDLTRQGITGNELNCLLDDPQDSILWIGTQRAGLNAYDYVNNTFLCYRHDDENPESLITDDVTKIVAATDGNLWITTYWRGVDYFDKKAGKFIHYNTQTVPGLASDNIWSVVDGGDGKLYMGHVHHGFSVLSLKDKKVKNFMYDPEDPVSLPGNGVTCIYKDLSGNIWLGTDRGLALFNPEAENFIHFHHSEDGVPHTVFDIRQFDGNKLWIAMEFGGIAILDLTQRMFLSPDQVRFQYIKEGDDEYSLSNSTVRCLFQDSFKNVWAGMWGGGINFLSHESSYFNVYSYSPIQHSGSSLNNKTASSVCVARDGKLWIGTDGGGINVFDKGKRVAVYKEETGDLTDNSIQAALCDSEGNLWFGSFMGGVDFYDVKKKSFHQIFPKDKTGEDVRALYEDAEYVWIGTSNGIYKVRLHDKGIADHYTVENNLVRCISKDNLNRLWIGTFGGGLGVFDEHFQCVKLFNVTSLFPSNTINTVYMDSQNRMWIGTGEGLVCFPSSQSWDYKVYRSEEGLSNVHIRAITEDNHGNIWVSTNKGISCYIAVKNSFYNYGRWDGVPIVGFMSGSVTHDYDGNIYFGSLNGLCRFNPEMVLAKREAPSAIMTGLRIFVPISERKSEEKMIELHGCPAVRLSYMQNNFSVTFNIQNYALADQVEYAYMLKGLENSWYTVTDPNNVTFRNIPPGNYCFQVKTRIRNQEWADEIASLDIRIDPPVWLTWWAKLFYILSGVSVLYFILHAYKKKLDMESLYELEKKNHEQEQELNNERLRFYTNITHELRTPLTLILGPLEDMQKSNSLSGKDSQKISVIHQSAIRLLNLINQILEFRKTETQNKKLCVSRDNLAALVHEIGLKYKELNRKPEIDFCLEIEQEDMSLFFDKEVVTIILDNLISNAIKYTEKGTITLGLHQVVRNNIHHTEISVSDTGFGIAPDALPHIFDRYYQEGSEHQASGTGIGLALVKNLVVLHEGEIRVESSLNVGSTFYVSLLTDNTYPHVLHADSTEKTSDEKDEKEENIEPVHSGKRILLIVEDNRDICDYIVESFSDDFEVRTAANGEQGLEQALGCIPDIIVSDIMMPVMNGIVMCRKLKEDLRTSHIPIILLTAKDSLQDKEEGYQVGADSYLTKPFSATLLHSRIHNLLESRKLLAERFNTNSILIDKRAAVTESMNKLDNEFLEKINKLIEDRLSSEKIDIGYLSDAMCMSNSTLYRKMKALTGLSTNEYIRKIKMQYAERLLLEGKYNISEVAFKVGINSTVYFRQCFKDEFGMAPSDYLKKIKPE
ncbi:hybrid sensor histidine kinase/response regulator transcription factor [Phocaeicola dorei]|uniref:histidine kinase n=1 Tax=Bacteroides uniformis TaxID=820 RepID=A0ABS5X1A0_BACUN|nr:two-component regulator propeller domain-containing protein [Phocaeicola dorei]MBT8725706.1 response regulator [Bacteroides uniformis]RJV48619.1 response regulator [Bacteroides sp. AF25-18]MBT1292633.1 response regulator [Phocaeicola dorei]MBT1301385.1 response regulator [Phocaeicola dorei]MBT9910215.1 response regulator [Phocaeicola dorei]